MPKKLKKRLRAQGIAKGLTGERLEAFVHATTSKVTRRKKRKASPKR